MTENKIQFLSLPYLNPNFSQYIEIERFYDDLKLREFFINKGGKKIVKLIEHQNEIVYEKVEE